MTEESPESPPDSNHTAIYLLRTVQQHHVQLSMMADHKASIIIGAAVVVLAMIFGQVASAGHVSVAMVVLGITVMTSAILAAFAVMPQIGKPANGHRNPLFFGHFLSSSEDEFVEEMNGILKTDVSVHEAMARDIYQMGAFLKRRKFAQLAWSYRVLIVGGIISGLIFLAEAFPG